MNVALKRYFNRCVLLMIAQCIGCGTWVGNPQDPDDENKPQGNSTVNIEFSGEQPAAALTLAALPVYGKGGSEIGLLTLTQARVVLDEIKLKVNANDLELQQEYKGPFIVNLLTNQVSPSPGAISINSGIYSEIELKLHKLEKDQATLSEGDPLIENSIYLTGSFKPTDGAARNLTMTFEFGEEFRIASQDASGVKIEEGAINNVLVAFDLAAWFNFAGREHDLGEIEGQQITLNKDSDELSKKVREAIKENVKLSAEFSKKE